jgi:multidrug efflux system membrane fusion protein
MRYPTWVPALFAALLPLGCSGPPAARPAAPPAPAVVTTAGRKTVPIRLRAIGSVKAIASVAIRPRVGGELVEVGFKEGDFVEKGQKLFVIDPRPYEAAVKQARANLAKSLAVLKGAELEMRRAEGGRATGVAAASDYDAALTALGSAKAPVEADRAAVNCAELQAGYTTITSPLTGRAGEQLVTRGNLVDANGPGPLVVINQVSPIYVTFSLPEQQLPVVLEARKRGALKAAADLRGGGPLATGELAFIDNAADPATGTVQFKATFPNADQRLWPGLFVDVTVTLGQRPDSVVVPTAALQSGQKGQYVYVVTAEKKAEMRPVTVAFEEGGEAVIASGLSGGEAVVVEGQLRLAPGAPVDPRPLAGRPTSPAVPRVAAGGAE